MTQSRNLLLRIGQSKCSHYLFGYILDRTSILASGGSRRVGTHNTIPYARIPLSHLDGNQPQKSIISFLVPMARRRSCWESVDDVGKPTNDEKQGEKIGAQTKHTHIDVVFFSVLPHHFFLSNEAAGADVSPGIVQWSKLDHFGGIRRSLLAFTASFMSDYNENYTFAHTIPHHMHPHHFRSIAFFP